jgi:hypothetical protein
VWTGKMPMASAFSPESPRIHRLLSAAKKHFATRRVAGEGRRAVVIMHATLQQPAREPYYGQWPMLIPKE